VVGLLILPGSWQHGGIVGQGVPANLHDSAERPAIALAMHARLGAAA
jgi:hypothetical protein